MEEIKKKKKKKENEWVNNNSDGDQDEIIRYDDDFLEDPINDGDGDIEDN